MLKNQSQAAHWESEVRKAERVLSRMLFHRTDRNPQTRTEPDDIRAQIAEVRYLREKRDAAK